MRVDDVRHLYEYNYWANARLFTALAQLTPEEFVRSVAGSYGSVRNTLVHILSAEWGWLDRCGGHPRGPKLNYDDFPTLQSVIAKWSEVEGYTREFLRTLTDADLARTIEFSFNPSESHSRPLGHLLHHAVNHAVHHRGQVALLARMLGHAPGNFDLLFFEEPA